MLSRVASWPKIIGLSVAVFGVSVACSAWILDYGVVEKAGTIDASVSGPPRILFNWLDMTVSVALLIVAGLVGTGREWARRILLVAVVAVGLILLVREGADAVLPMTVGHTSPEDMPTVVLWHRLQQFSELFVILAQVVFAVLFLSHPGVVASFGHRGNSPRKA